MAKRIVFHIGLEKTGTTSFQQFCSEHCDALLGNGVLYPKDNLGFAADSGQHAFLAACYLPREAQSFCFLPNDSTRKTIVESLLEEIDRAKAGTVLISSEFFSSRFGEVEIARLAKDFVDYECHLIAAVRPHLDRLMSEYSSAIGSGLRLTFEEHVQSLLARNAQATIFGEIAYRTPRYETTLSCWERHFSNRLWIVNYSSSSDVTQAILEKISPTIDVPGTPLRTNVSLPPRLIEQMRLVNSLFPTYEELLAVGKLELWGKVCAERQATMNYIRSTVNVSAFDLQPAPIFFLGKETHASLNAIIATDRIWLREKYGVELKG